MPPSVSLAVRVLFVSFAVGFCGWDVPSIDYMEVNRGRDVRDILGSIGLLAVSNIPGYAAARTAALHAWLACSASLDGAEREGVIGRRLLDGSLRRTAAGTTRDGALLPMKMPGCSEFERKADILRAVVNMVSAQIMHAWDSDEPSRGVLLRHERGGVMTSLLEAVNKAEHLEHFHVYTAPPNHSGRGDTQSKAVPRHTDAGLLLLFTSPLYQGNTDHSSGLWFTWPDGATNMIDLPSDSLMLMVGEAALWLPFRTRPAPHELQLPHGSVRAWYGQMIRLPIDAVQPQSFDPTSVQQRTFGEWWHNTSAALTEGHGLGVVGLGCGAAEYAADMSRSCSAGEKYCWMQCMTLPAACNDSTAQCMHTDGTPWVNQTEMCPTCTLKCPLAVGDHFCDRPSASDMLMTGFATYGYVGNTKNPCIILFFKSWVLDTPLKFWLGVFGIFALGFAVEGFSRISQRPEFHRGGALSAMLLHVIRMTLAYLLMLGVMTFSVEIFISIVLGLSVGHAAFRPKSKGKPNQVVVGLTPCCNHGGEESVDGGIIMRQPLNADSSELIEGADACLCLQLEGLTCATCVATVTRALEGVDGVMKARVALEPPPSDGGETGLRQRGRAAVFVKKHNLQGTDALISAVDGVGFEAHLISQ